jgi:hypothetical protein
MTLTGAHRDGEWLRVRHWGMHFADLRTVEQLAEVIDLATLEEALGGAAASTADARIRVPANTGALACIPRLDHLPSIISLPLDSPVDPAEALTTRSADWLDQMPFQARR